jgi:2-polyprenyl-3-methyl-5-hydroxy-6-metoxy-1,4-benzoquinol methylase
MNKKFNELRYSQEFIPTLSDKTRVSTVINLIGQNKKVLDLGCMHGHIGNLIKLKNNVVYGVETSRFAAKNAKSKLNRVYNFSLENNWSRKISERFDIVFAGEIIEHIFDTDNFLKNIHNLLKKNGCLILTTPNVASLGRRLLLLLGLSPNLEITSRKYDSGHIRYFTLATLTMLLEQNGFNVLIKTSNVIQFTNDGKISSRVLARLLPTFGTTLIVKAQKK